MKDTIDKSLFKELKDYSGSENYEVVELLDKNFKIRENILLDELKNKIVVYGYKENKLEPKKSIYNTKHISNLGDEIGEIRNSYRTLKDGTIWGGYFYCNFNIDGDATKHKFLDPFSNKRIEDTYEFISKETNPDKWMTKFQEYYKNASYVKISRNDSKMYYLKVDDKWYFMENTLEGTPENLKKQYPAKEPENPRMLEMEDLAPEYYHPQQGADDNDLIKMKEYESTFFEKEDQGLGSYNFSAGWWYLEIYMPLGDTIRIKRYSNYEDPEIELYKIPAANGGREDVLFIVQKPEEMFPEQVGGMYVIRPRDIAQPERRYSSVSYGTRENGEEYIVKSEDTEEYTRWQQNKIQ